MKKALGFTAATVFCVYAVMGMSLSADNWATHDKVLAAALVLSVLGLAGQKVTK